MLDLPTDVETLQALLLQSRTQIDVLRTTVVHHEALIDKLQLQLARLRRMQFGRASEKLSQEIEQLELLIEELETAAPRAAESTPPSMEALPEKPQRRPLPEHLPRETEVHAAACACPTCGGALQPIGEDVAEMLEYVPSHFKVIRHVRPKHVCRACERVVQAPAPARPIARGLAGPGLLAHVLVSKYADGLPLYRQSEIYARDGVTLDRSTMADWVGGCLPRLQPLVERLAQTVMAAGKLHADDTPIRVLSPGAGKTRTGRMWVYVRDDRPWAGATPPAVLFRYTPDRRGEHPQRHLKDFSGILQADGYAGFQHLYDGQRVFEAACMAHVRRKFFDFFEATQSPIAAEALQRIRALYAIESDLKGQPADQRSTVRQSHAGPLLDDFKHWLQQTERTLSKKAELAKAIRYALTRWPALTRYVGDGTIEIDNSAAERALRTVAMTRKNFLFLGSDAGGERAAAVYSLIGTARLNGLDPEAYLRHVIQRMTDQPDVKLDDLLPWNVGDQVARIPGV